MERVLLREVLMIGFGGIEAAALDPRCDWRLNTWLAFSPAMNFCASAACCGFCGKIAEL